MADLYMMVGLPGSGKSTYAKEVMMNLIPSCAYVSRDEVRYEMIDDQKHYFDRESDVYREYCNRIEMHLLRGENVIADATHLNIGSRKKLMNTLKTKPDHYIAMVMQTPFEICMERNSKREGIIHVPEQTMYKMKHSYHVPKQTEGFSQINFIKV